MEFTRDYFVHYYEADSSRRLTLPALVQYLEDIAIVHSSSVGLDLSYYRDNRCGWMLLKWDVEIRALPSFGDSVRVSTRVHAMKGFMADREFALHAADGTELARARSNWLLVDTERRRPMRVPQDQYERFGVSPESSSSFVTIADVAFPVRAARDGPPPSEGLSPSCEPSSRVRARHGDIDTNRHVNNVRYLAWALDTLPGDFFDRMSPVGLRANYRKELALDDEAEVFTSLSESTGSAESCHAIRNGVGDMCLIEINWKAANV